MAKFRENRVFTRQGCQIFMVQHTKTVENLPKDQGDQIGRIFTHLAIVYFGQIF
jgi:hypothetical protein